MLKSLSCTQGSSVVKNPPANAGDAGSILELRRSPGVGNGNHSSILAWKIPGTEEAGGLSPRGCKESNMTEKVRTVNLT